MSTWMVQDAKAKFSELLETCLNEGPQIVSRRGVEAAVLVSVAEWRRLQQSARPGLKALLLAASPRTSTLAPRRNLIKRPEPADLT